MLISYIEKSGISLRMHTACLLTNTLRDEHNAKIRRKKQRLLARDIKMYTGICLGDVPHKMELRCFVGPSPRVQSPLPTSKRIRTSLRKFAVDCLSKSSASEAVLRHAM